jgi:hypothetical protein
MEAFESGVLDLPDFYFTCGDYRYRFEPEAKEGFLGLLRERFNSGVAYKGRMMKWDTVIEQKTVEPGHLMIGRSEQLDFSEPSPKLKRTDDYDLQKRILKLSQSDARKLGIGKNALHYMRRRARSGRSLEFYSKTQKRLHLIKPLPYGRLA